MWRNADLWVMYAVKWAKGEAALIWSSDLLFLLLSFPLRRITGIKKVINIVLIIKKKCNFAQEISSKTCRRGWTVYFCDFCLLEKETIN